MLGTWRREVADMMADGEMFTRVEDFVNDLPAGPEIKAGLWLQAFSLLGQDSQQRLVTHYLETAEGVPA